MAAPLQTGHSLARSDLAAPRTGGRKRSSHTPFNIFSCQYSRQSLYVGRERILGKPGADLGRGGGHSKSERPK